MKKETIATNTFFSLLCCQTNTPKTTTLEFTKKDKEESSNEQWAKMLNHFLSLDGFFFLQISKWALYVVLFAVLCFVVVFGNPVGSRVKQTVFSLVLSLTYSIPQCYPFTNSITHHVSLERMDPKLIKWFGTLNALIGLLPLMQSNKILSFASDLQPNCLKNTSCACILLNQWRLAACVLAAESDP